MLVMREKQLTFGPFRIEPREHALYRGPTRLVLGTRPLRLLAHLVRNSGRLVTKQELLEAVWPDAHVAEAVLKTSVAEIRRVLGDPAESPQFVVNERGVGYRFIAPVGIGNVPVPLTGLIGRESELATIKQLLMSHRLVTLWGASGLGKTRLAIQVAADLVPHTPHGVWWIGLGALSDPSLVAQTVAAVLAVRERPGHGLLDTLIDACQDRQFLLVLDNCEHLVTACASLVEALLGEASRLRILATSREPLGLDGETVWPLPPLALPLSSADAAEVVASESGRFFLERARQADPFFAVTDLNATAVAQICRRLEGLPLAIELAAGRVKVLAPEQIAARLDDVFSVLGQEHHGRHHTLKAATDWSYDLLSPKEQVLLARLSVFSGSFTLEAAEAICSDSELPAVDVFDLLARLVGRSLVNVVTAGPGTHRYQLLEIIRQYARRKLPSDSRGYFRRHAAFFLQLAEQIVPEIRGPSSELSVSHLNMEYHNIRSALQWCREAGDKEEGIGIRLAAVLWIYWIRRGLVGEGLNWTEAMLECSGSTAPEVRAEALCGAGVLRWVRGDNQLARARLEKSLALWRSIGEGPGLARALHYLGALARERGDLATARQMCQESVEICRRASSPWDLAVGLSGLGAVASLEGRLHEAVALYEEAVDLFRAIADPWILSFALRQLATLATAEHQYARAEPYWRESVGLLKSVEEDLGGLSHGLEGMAAVHRARGDCARAARLLGAAGALRARVEWNSPTPWRSQRESLVARLIAALGEQAFNQYWTEGVALSPDEAVALALRVDPEPCSSDRNAAGT
jgi:predicted ATPase/DNA-binding winged helix-turn-helix (wHTH) protein